MTNTNAAQDLAFIKQVIEDSRKNASGFGDHMMVWGIITSIGMIVSYILIQMQMSGNIEWIHWALLIAGGWTFELIYGWKVERKKPVLSYADKVSSGLWSSFGISMTMLGFIGIYTGGISIQFLSPIFCCVLAIGFFTSGFLYDTKWMRYIAMGYWVGALIMFFIPGTYHLLYMAAMTIGYMVIPGYKMRSWA